jgi:hypothetical protein
MEVETYTSVVVVLSTAFLLVAGLAKKQLVWRRPRPLPSRRAGAAEERMWFA